jgi:hypothetical protein
LTQTAALFKDDNAECPAVSTNVLLALERDLSNTPAPTWEMCRDMALTCRAAMDDAKGMQWGAKACELFLGTPTQRAALDLPAVREFACWIDRIHLVAAKHEFPELAETLLAFAQDGRLRLAKGDGALFGRLLMGPATRARLQTGIEDRDGLPRPTLGEIVTWAQRCADDMETWKKHVEDRVAATEGDRKALWLVIQGAVETVRITPVQPGRRGVWLDAAEKTAQTDPVRQQIALSRGY